ncbi:XRE family transcriptional regulator [Pseudomonas chlororaphis]|uniref:XRE family transcriptional regulator n=1 Tax=Pseudomonas chlororaphis TaxID=587753 RepID=UPI000F57BBB1|nr:XRE family transcriptional regulator [Pseudomonas chlororaphis]MBP5054947.1 helix-turn-helix transcriptional regulator [Pseudomonas chlororaphis]MBP5139254.1 helix-turn-helix transcriptional regulator [Pseudomonas chlororaphis]QTT98669.1 helix-turn-helix transcriptional regulator [Pseudomonas chlororaphis]WDG45761.1 S24 family peptidase [Pseudomonas chlororaphis]
MNNETLGSRIKRLRKLKGISQQALAEVCGWSSQSRIGNYERDLREPSLTDLILLAPALGVSVAELVSGVDSKDLKASLLNADPMILAWSPKSPADAVKLVGATKEGVVPVVGTAKLGMDGYFEALDFPVGHGDGYLLIHSDDPNAYGLKVIGDSMHPRIKNGEFVLIEPNKTFIAGDEVMVKTHDGRSMIKEFIYLRDGVYRFDSVNQDHSPIHLAQVEVDKVHLVSGILKSSRFTHDSQ